jgi:hypothetical protein
MKTAKFLPALALILLFGCNSNQPQDDINMNEGVKWVVNAEMKPHIQKGNALLDDFIEQKGTDYLELAKNLKAQNDELIQSCTMTGESHDELHKWLYPHIGLINELSQAKTMDEAEDIITKLDKSFITYQNHFE